MMFKSNILILALLWHNQPTSPHFVCGFSTPSKEVSLFRSRRKTWSGRDVPSLPRAGGDDVNEFHPVVNFDNVIPRHHRQGRSGHEEEASHKTKRTLPCTNRDSGEGHNTIGSNAADYLGVTSSRQVMAGVTTLFAALLVMFTLNVESSAAAMHVVPKEAYYAETPFASASAWMAVKRAAADPDTIFPSSAVRTVSEVISMDESSAEQLVNVNTETARAAEKTEETNNDPLDTVTTKIIEKETLRNDEANAESEVTNIISSEKDNILDSTAAIEKETVRNDEANENAETEVTNMISFEKDNILDSTAMIQTIEKETLRIDEAKSKATNAGSKAAQLKQKLPQIDSESWQYLQKDNDKFLEEQAAAIVQESNRNFPSSRVLQEFNGGEVDDVSSGDDLALLAVPSLVLLGTFAYAIISMQGSDGKDATTAAAATTSAIITPVRKEKIPIEPLFNNEKGKANAKEAPIIKSNVGEDNSNMMAKRERGEAAIQNNQPVATSDRIAEKKTETQTWEFDNESSSVPYGLRKDVPTYSTMPPPPPPPNNDIPSKQGDDAMKDNSNDADKKWKKRPAMMDPIDKKMS
eukprot:CAMPEP_0183743222 /NCGR_PEP_ID=MMETSP0737-20130205/65107_1 /TAXON_ID=385413 /ORGANISM="Thalassiosira miniscula, Strain CCMP1093" /LENGTH=579 /DNA_ID=CAMNT_0025978831 /DNA_START=8 /DNA_END=1748 /DNA_ORIENTATION=-